MITLEIREDRYETMCEAARRIATAPSLYPPPAVLLAIEVLRADPVAPPPTAPLTETEATVTRR